MRNILFALLTLLAVWAIPSSGFCSTTDLSTTQVQTLKEINTEIGVVHKLADRKVVTPEAAAQAESLLVQDAKQVVGHDVTASEIQALVTKADKTEGLGVFWNIVIVAAGIMFLLAIVGLLAFYLKDLLAEIPAGVYEVFAYIGTGVLAASGYLWQPFQLGMVAVEPLWFAVPGALGLAGCLFLTHSLHFKSNKNSDTVWMGPGLVNFPTVMFALCTGAWATMAVYYNHMFPAAGIPHILAFGAVIALQAALGFSAVTMPGCIALGWREDRQVPKSVTSSLMILGAYVGLKVTSSLTGDLTLFEPGAVFMGAFVYFLGLLVMASKWYVWSGKSGKEDGRYVLLQVVTILSGVAALYLGSVYHMGALLGVGGTFFAIYLLEKYYEIPWKGVGWFWSLLGVAVILYFIVGFANTHSQYFVWGIQ